LLFLKKKEKGKGAVSIEKHLRIPRGGWPGTKERPGSGRSVQKKEKQSQVPTLKNAPRRGSITEAGPYQVQRGKGKKNQGRGPRQQDQEETMRGEDTDQRTKLLRIQMNKKTLGGGKKIISS